MVRTHNQLLQMHLKMLKQARVPRISVLRREAMARKRKTLLLPKTAQDKLFQTLQTKIRRVLEYEEKMNLELNATKEVNFERMLKLWEQSDILSRERVALESKIWKLEKAGFLRDRFTEHLLRHQD